MFSKLMNGLRDKLRAGKEAVLAQMNQVTKRDDLERVVAVYYLIGIADGNFDADEKASMMKAIQSNPALKSFSDDDIMAAYRKIDGFYDLAVPMGNRKALALLEGIDDAAFREELMMFACVAGAADGSFDDDEKEVARKIAAALKQNPADFADFGL